MDRSLLRAYLVELLGTFAVVFFGAGVVCVNYVTTPSGQQPATANLLGMQPGLVGIALAHGLILAVVLAVTVPVTGGYLNPAVSLMLWVFNRLSSRRGNNGELQPIKLDEPARQVHQVRLLGPAQVGRFAQRRPADQLDKDVGHCARGDAPHTHARHVSHCVAARPPEHLGSKFMELCRA